MIVFCVFIRVKFSSLRIIFITTPIESWRKNNEIINFVVHPYRRQFSRDVPEIVPAMVDFVERTVSSEIFKLDANLFEIHVLEIR